MSRRIIKIFVLNLWLILVACSTPKYVDSPKDFKYNIHGLYANFKLNDRPSIIGEIIEVQPDIIRILPLSSNMGITTFSKDLIKSAEILVALSYDNPKKIYSWSGLMGLTSIAHGFWGVFTLPINVTTAISMNNSTYQGAYKIKYPDKILWKDMSKFARFPQGIPKNINVSLIK